MEEERFSALEKRVTVLERDYAVGDVLRLSVEKRLSSIEDTLKWLVRLILGAILLAAVAFVIGGGLV